MAKLGFQTSSKSLKKHNIQKNKMKEQHGTLLIKIKLMFEVQVTGPLSFGGSVRLIAIHSTLRAM